MSNTELWERAGKNKTTIIMELNERKNRLEECLEAQRLAARDNLKEALKRHRELNEYIQENGITSKTEEKIENTLKLNEIYETFDKKLSEYIDLLKKEIEELTQNQISK